MPPSAPSAPGPAARAPALRRALSLAREALLRPGGMAALLLAVVAVVGGATDPVDDALWGRVYGLRAQASRGQVPTVLAIDDATIARLGAPPWGAEAWTQVLDALARQDLGPVWLSDPWPRLVRPDALTAPLPPGLVRTPRAVWDARELPIVPTEAPWLGATDATLALTRPGKAVGVHVETPEGTWGLCAHADVACTTAPAGRRLGLRDADVPIVPLHVLLDAPPRFLSLGEAGALLGVTSPIHGDSVVTGPSGAAVPWVVATAQVAGATRLGPPLQTLSPSQQVGWLLSLYLVVGLGILRRPGPRWLLAAPALALALTGLAVAWTGLHPPLAGALGAALAPVVGWLAATSQAASQGLRRLVLLVVRAASRAGTLRRRLSDPAELVAVVADLTRSHAGDVPFCVLLDLPGHGAVFAGGVGVTAAELVPEALKPGHPDLVAARGAWLGLTSRRVLSDGRPVRVVPLRQADAVVAYWVLAPHLVDRTPDAHRIARLARWVGERLALTPHGPARDELLPGSGRDEALENLFTAADEERRRWTTCVHALATPVVVADVAGVIDAINPALDDALQEAGLLRPRSLRELLLSVGGEERLDERVRRLFMDDRPVSAPWPDGGWLVVRPLSPGSDTSPLLGYIGWIEVAAVPPPVAQGARGYDAEATLLDLPPLGTR